MILRTSDAAESCSSAWLRSRTSWASFGPAPAICADLGALRPFTAAFRRRGLIDADLAVERRFMDLSEG
jgi:hypothetical protein